MSFKPAFRFIFHFLMVFFTGFLMVLPWFFHQEGCMGWSEADVLVLLLLAALRQWGDPVGKLNYLGGLKNKWDPHSWMKHGGFHNYMVHIWLMMVNIW